MAESKEEEYVHRVYNEIATHFSETRYKPWPIVEAFLKAQACGSVGLDVGCGNGKYLGVNPGVFLIGSDRSEGLIGCAQSICAAYNVLVADGLHLPHRDGTFDFAISIAVVHHWATRERRIAAIRHILAKLRDGGELLVYCWALEQRGSRRGYHEGMDQDVLVPWVLQRKQQPRQSRPKAVPPDLSGVPAAEREAHLERWRREQRELRAREEPAAAGPAPEQADTKYRYYHLYREGELQEDCQLAGGVVLRDGYEKDNWYVVVQKPHRQPVVT
ncbi:ADR181Wp [Eremothecium gossypii ATCC 10895]|uniref:ADR181Wp n=1 Tax=Eremothecium gossypii (strain ATCC 10895 / CBS 109.51 / FGSC 9923 / NRRL Y-1056) TaxID=284811 RepID=Q759U2_EREGS|nr:ADR181Wp [Eremothecium gossypii ATCC 10895]AAS52101.2 ADR181Wp [Eremothecium gossypii ATCC 10895]AEY96400.1 FADR181Wp [Eremothecium gossypii FDAG1]